MRLSKILFLALTVLASCGAEPVEFICHRGLKGEAPENTIPAIELALAAGCDVVEVDIRISRDGQVVLMHDADISRTTNGRGKVGEMDYEQIRAFDAAVRFPDEFQGTHVPTLREAISATQGHGKLYLDLKTRQVDLVTSAVRNSSFSDATYYRVYTPNEAQRVCQLDPDASVVIDIGSFSLGATLIEKLYQDCPNLVLGSDLNNWTEDSAAQAHSLGIPIIVNLLGTQSTARNLQRALSYEPKAVLVEAKDEVLK